MAFIPPIVDFSRRAIIAASGSTSAAVDLEGGQLCGIIVPSAITGTAVTITMSTEVGGTYVTVQDGDGADLSITITASKYIPINNLALTTGLRFIKLVSNGTEAAERTFIIVTRPIA